MDGGLEIAAEDLDQLVDVESNIPVSEVHEGPAPALAFTALGSRADPVIEAAYGRLHPGRGVPTEDLKNTGDGSVDVPAVLGSHSYHLSWCNAFRFLFQVLVPVLPGARGIGPARVDFDITDRTLGPGGHSTLAGQPG